METKICKKCGLEKELCEYDKTKKYKDGYFAMCKNCREKHFKDFREKNREKNRKASEKWKKNNTEIIKKNQKKYYWDNREKRLNNRKEWYEKNRERVINKTIEWQSKNKERINKLRNIRHNDRYKNDILYKIKINVRNRIKHFLKSKNFNEIKNGTFNIVGASPETLKEHIEKQFKEGMSWENYGHNGWHIDHIIPLSEAKTEEDVYKLCQYSNLQPLWANENYKKGNKI